MAGDETENMAADEGKKQLIHFKCNGSRSEEQEEQEAVFVWILPEADPETGIQVQVVYLGGDPKKYPWGMGRRQGRAGSQ